MGISVVTGPAFEPASLAEVKDHCRHTITEEDGLLAGYILAARQYVENETRRVLVTQTLDYTIDRGWPQTSVRGYWRTRIELPYAPVSAITSITYVDSSGASQTLASNQYVLRGDESFAYIDRAYDVTWPQVRDQDAAITVRFVAGWSVESVPDPLRTAICLHVEMLLDREPLSRETLGLARDSMLDHYRIRRIL